MKKQSKGFLTVMLVLSLCLLMMAGCGTTSADSDTGANSQTSTPSKVLLVVSFGTSYNDNRDLSIGGIEKALQTAYPDYEVRRALTSQIIIDKLKERDSIKIDNVKQAMDRLVADGIKEVVIQPTHVMDGFEYDDIISEVTPYKDKFDSFKIGKNLLSSDADYQEVAKVIAEETKAYDADGTAIVFMGHGTEAPSNATYAKMQQTLTDASYKRYFVGTVEATPALEDVMALVKASGATKVVLEPLMIVAGDHANNDMAGDEEGSWKTEFEKAGFEVECVIKGLGQMKGIQDLIVKHAGETIAPPVPGGESTQTSSQVNTSAEDVQNTPAEDEKLEPIYGSQIKDGTYSIEVSSSSSMFQVVDAQLTVAGGKMSAVLTLSGTGYEKLYMGTGEEALADTDDKCIYFVKNAEGKYTYKVPVAALNQDVNCAAWSIKKQQWYDRVLVFQSTLIPKDAISAEASVQLPADGQYTIEVTLTGGTGRAKVESPAKLTVSGGKAAALIVWSSSNYTYMMVDGTKYNPVNTEGNSTFEIPVSLDEDMAITTETIAMSAPHVVDYTLRFDSATLKKQG